VYNFGLKVYYFVENFWSKTAYLHLLPFLHRTPASSRELENPTHTMYVGR
jgi:hypothetical protein